MNRLFKIYLLYYPIFWVGYFFFVLSKKTNWYPYIAFRRLFVLTKGKSNDRMSKSISKSHPSLETEEVSGVLGKLDRSTIHSITKSIQANGYYIFEEKLEPSIIEELIKFSLITETELIPKATDGTKRALYNNKNILTPRYQFDEQALLEQKTIQRINFDESLYAVAQSYLNCKPIQDLTAMWWSAAFTKEASSEAAQLFHFDMDRIKFIKFFFYLTDVSTFNGPHCYIKGSHLSMPEAVWKDGRIKDSEIYENYKKEDVLEITGAKGTIIAVDTRGLHKGKVLEKGERLLLQVEFTNSLFGATYNNINLKQDIDETIKIKVKNNLHSFQRFKV